MFEQTFKTIDDVLHKDVGCTSELDYTEQSSWLLFLNYLDALEHMMQAMRGVPACQRSSRLTCEPVPRSSAPGPISRSCRTPRPAAGTSAPGRRSGR